MYSAALLVIGLCAPGLLSAATLTVTGKIPCHGNLRLVTAAQATQIAMSNHSITLRPARTEGGLPVALSLRTNCAYQLVAAWKGKSDREARISAPTVSAAAGTGHLTSMALHVTATAAQLKSEVPAVCLEGPMVSRGGNDATVDNAILIELVLQAPVGVASDSVTFTLGLKP